MPATRLRATLSPVTIHKSQLRRRAEAGPGSRERDPQRHRADTAFSALTRLVMTGSTARPDAQLGELDELPLPDLLSPNPATSPDSDSLLNQLELAFLGRTSTGELDRELDMMPAGDSAWTAAQFADDLFLTELVRGVLAIRIRGQRVRMHRGFVQRMLASPPADLATTRFRQAILRELDEDRALRTAAEDLLSAIIDLLTLLRASRDDARLEPIRFRVDVLRTLRDVVELMADRFASSRSGLQRLAQVGDEIRRSRAFQRLTAFLDHHMSMATLSLEAVIGADGRLRHLEIAGAHERRRNPFYRRPLRRWWDRLRVFYRRYNLDSKEIVERLVSGVYRQVSPALARVVQVAAHLEVHLASITFADDARARGLAVCLPELAAGAVFEARAMFNPLLLALVERPVPSDLATTSAHPVVLVTGPNSGGKTRLLQAIGITQVLAQSGLFAPCASARLPLAAALFASIIELDRAFQSEGRLGTELVRLRTLFETSPPGTLVLLDELCSGTNPSEAIEIMETVLRLLHQLQPVAFVTTHFLDFAQQLHARAARNGTEFLHAEVDGERGPTYRFVPGVAATSLAVGTARRLGVTFDELARRLEDRAGEGSPTD